MKYIIIFIFIQLNIQIAFSKVDTLQVNHNGNSYFNISDSINKRVIFFLHGGVNNPYFKENEDVSLNFLLEDNVEFINALNKNNFDIIIPITNDSLNWLYNTEYCFKEFQNYINSLNKNYKEIWISGFSDGGTGSFKLFYNNPYFFNGLVVFNGYPYHKNFASNLDYSAVTNKKIVFFCTKQDKQIQYEFSLSAYSMQKTFNPNTFFYLTDGEHSFGAYKKNDFELLFRMLMKVNNKEKKSFHALILDDRLIEFYDFRKSVVRKYGFGDEYYKQNIKQKTELKKLGHNLYSK